MWRKAGCCTVVCRPESGKWSKPNSSLKRPQSVLCPPDLACMLCGLSALSSLSMAFTGNKPPRMASSRLNVDSLSLRDWQFTSSLPPDSGKRWINTVGLRRERWHMWRRGLRTQPMQSLRPITWHPSAGWWIPLIKDLWCCIPCSVCTPSALSV